MGELAPNRIESHPRVSVIIPVYNGEPTIGAAIQSVLAQTFRDFEIIVVDDGSTDATASILERFASRITIIKQANRGFCDARNAGIANSQGGYLALLDADDTWLPSKLEKTIAVLDRSPQVVLVCTDVINQDAAGRASAPRRSNRLPRTRPRLRNCSAGSGRSCRAWW
jgi:glycosyltransferase involved in cell wall biosynthesis